MKEKVKKAKEEGRIILGYKETIKNLDKVKRIFLAKNCPRKIKNKIKKEVGKGEVQETNKTNVEIGKMLGKPFSVSCLGIKEWEKSS